MAAVYHYKIRKCLECGAEVEKSKHNARTQYCDYHQEIRTVKQERKSKTSLKARFRKMRSGAKRREIEFTLSFEQYLEIVKSQRCEYNSNHALPEYGGGVDRKHVDIGYVNGNCAPCCWLCNDRKGKLEACGFSYERILQLLEELNDKEQS